MEAIGLRLRIPGDLAEWAARIACWSLELRELTDTHGKGRTAICSTERDREETMDVSAAPNTAPAAEGTASDWRYVAAELLFSRERCERIQLTTSSNDYHPVRSPELTSTNRCTAVSLVVPSMPLHWDRNAQLHIQRPASTRQRPFLSVTFELRRKCTQKSDSLSRGFRAPEPINKCHFELL